MVPEREIALLEPERVNAPVDSNELVASLRKIVEFVAKVTPPRFIGAPVKPSTKLTAEPAPLSERVPDPTDWAFRDPPLIKVPPL